MPRTLMSLALLLVLLFAASALVYCVGRLAPRAAGPLAVSAGAAAFAAVLTLWTRGGATFTLDWAPTWNLRLELALDGLAAAFALAATGIGTLVALYATRYMPPHLEKTGAAATELARFHALMLLFMASMLGLVVAHELYALVVFFDLTAVVSFLLIGTDRHEREARGAALLAMIVTAGAAVALLVGIVLLHLRTGTTLVDDVAARVGPAPLVEIASLLILAGAIAKSAQVPLHFWLPRAMVAPTPVSAYLHSAAMVAAGVFVVSRVHPILAVSDRILTLVAAVGAVSILVGSVMALGASQIKRILAYSTVAQYGYVMVMLGWGGPTGAAAAVFYVLAHAVIKSGLFMTAGVAIEAFHGGDRLPDLGGLRRTMPGLALSGAVLAAGLSALPGTVGFFKDELFYKAALEHGPIAIAGATLAASLTFAYTWRWWAGIFLGDAHETHAPSWSLQAPIVLLAAIVLGAGLAPAPFAALAEAAGAVMVPSEVHVDVAYHLAWRTEYAMAAVAFAVGALLLVIARAADVQGWAERLSPLGAIGPAPLAAWSSERLTRLSTWLHDMEVRDLRDRAAAVLLPGGVLVLMAIASSPFAHSLRPGGISAGDLPLAAALALTLVAAAAVTRPARHLSLVIALSSVSYAIALVFALFGAPDVALVAVLIQTVLTMLLVAVLSLFRPETAREAAEAERAGRHRIVAWVAGGAAFLTVWAVLSWPAAPVTADHYIALAPEAHAHDVVTAVLADFRGLDTMGEATVIAVALIGVASLIAEARR